jgi:HAD superfamily hydrolase (TIGR01509 family)
MCKKIETGLSILFLRNLVIYVFTMLTTVIFDMDGVIIDSEPIHFGIERKMFEELNIVVPFEEHCTYVGASAQEMWQTIVTKHALSIQPDEMVKTARALYMDHIHSSTNVHPIDGVVELIQDLKKNDFKFLIASSSHTDAIDAIVEKLDLPNYFMARLSGAELKHSKPNPEIFLQAAKLANAEPQECMVIEDSRNGVIAAKAAGMKCVGYLNLNSGVQDLSRADIVISSFTELNATMIKNIK